MHHILAEIIQGGLVLETNVEDIDLAGMCGLAGNSHSAGNVCPFLLFSNSFVLMRYIRHTVQEASRARKESFASSNPLSLGGAGLGTRGTNIKTPLGWLTGKLTGVGAR